MSDKVEIGIITMGEPEEKKDLINFFLLVEEAKILTISIFLLRTACSIGVILKKVQIFCKFLFGHFLGKSIFGTGVLLQIRTLRF